MQLDRGTWIIATAPLTLIAGVSTSGGMLATLLLAACATNLVFTEDERKQLLRLAADSLKKLRGKIGRDQEYRVPSTEC